MILDFIFSKENSVTIIVAVISPLIVALIFFLINIFRAKKPRVLVHEAHPKNNPTLLRYYVKIHNRSRKNNYTVTNVWAQDKGGDKYFLEIPLPVTIEPTKIWETFMNKNEIIDHDNIFKNIRVELSNDKILKSKHNKNVASEGYVAALN